MRHHRRTLLTIPVWLLAVLALSGSNCQAPPKIHYVETNVEQPTLPEAYAYGEAGRTRGAQAIEEMEGFSQLPQGTPLPKTSTAEAAPAMTPEAAAALRAEIETSTVMPGNLAEPTPGPTTPPEIDLVPDIIADEELQAKQGGTGATGEPGASTEGASEEPHLLPEVQVPGLELLQPVSLTNGRELDAAAGVLLMTKYNIAVEALNQAEYYRELSDVESFAVDHLDADARSGLNYIAKALLHGWPPGGHAVNAAIITKTVRAVQRLTELSGTTTSETDQLFAFLVALSTVAGDRALIIPTCFFTGKLYEPCLKDPHKNDTPDDRLRFGFPPG